MALGPSAQANGPSVPIASAIASLPPRPSASEKRVVNPVHKRSKKGKKKGAKNVGAPEVTAAAKEMVDFKFLAKGMMPLDDQPMELDKNNAASGIILSKDRLSVTGHKGYRTVRATHGACSGTWYFEVTVTKLGATGHCRLGLCTKKSDVNMPVGADHFGYSYRDLEGTKQHKGLREPYGLPFGEGDVVGVYLHLPDGGRPMEQGLSDLVRYKGAFYYKEETGAGPEPLSGSAVAFSVNGKPQGVAYSDIFEGTYYPAAAIFTLPQQKEGASVTFNFGPDFVHGPGQAPGLPEAKPWCDAVQANAERMKREVVEAEARQQQEQQDGPAAAQAGPAAAAVAS